VFSLVGAVHQKLSASQRRSLRTPWRDRATSSKKNTLGWCKRLPVGIEVRERTKAALPRSTNVLFNNHYQSGSLLSFRWSRCPSLVEMFVSAVILFEKICEPHEFDSEIRGPYAIVARLGVFRTTRTSSQSWRICSISDGLWRFGETRGKSHFSEWYLAMFFSESTHRSFLQRRFGHVGILTFPNVFLNCCAFSRIQLMLRGTSPSTIVCWRMKEIACPWSVY